MPQWISGVMSGPTVPLAPRRSLIRTLLACGLAALVSACLVSTPPTARADPVATTALVLKVVDGDTVDTVDDVRGRLRIRLLGIDTPETKKPGFTVGCWGPEASEFAKSTLLGQRVAFVQFSPAARGSEFRCRRQPRVALETRPLGPSPLPGGGPNATRGDP
jgi:endonuclease YncB( thermonuclease family)